ncbi:MAG: GAF domain-containing sensor histidine kinase [Anaerolineales bacterium]
MKKKIIPNPSWKFPALLCGIGLILFLLGMAQVDLKIKLTICGLILFGGLGLNYLFEKKTDIQKLSKIGENVNKQPISPDNSKIETILKISQQFATAREEQQIIDLGLQLFMDLLDARAAAFTPFDERGQTLPVRVVGELPAEISGDWLEYLSSPSVRQKCPNCQRIERLNFDCPLLYSTTHVTGIYCAPVRRGDRELGIFHFFLPIEGKISPDHHAFQLSIPKTIQQSENAFEHKSSHEDLEPLIRLIADQTGLALESARLRNREARINHQLQNVHEQMDVGIFIQNILESANQGVKGKGTIVKLFHKDKSNRAQIYQVGNLKEIELDSLEEISQQIIDSQDMLIVNDGKKNGSIYAPVVIGLPILVGSRNLRGIMATFTEDPDGFNMEQRMMLKAIASQISLILQNSDNLAELEFRAILQERIRLAREIHDGLAQTLGFLKLRLSQLQVYFEKGEKEKEHQTIQQLYQVVSNAYIDTRSIIDQLRMNVEHVDLHDLLEEIFTEFKEASGVKGEIYYSIGGLQIPLEVNLQLVRIVQEALSNVRKHSHATHVQIACYPYDEGITIEVQDNGVGFDLNDLHDRSQYGIRGMNERASIIGGDIEIMSQIGKGTKVKINLPLFLLEGNRER